MSQLHRRGRNAPTVHWHVLILCVVFGLQVESFAPSSNYNERCRRPSPFRKPPRGLDEPKTTFRIRNQRLVTKANNGDDPNSNWLVNAFHKAGAKFRARPLTYLLIPCIAALVGWFTNWLAVQMIFYPIKFRGIPLYIKEEVPLGFLGWQGIVPCKTRPMTEAMVHMVTSQLLSVKEAFSKLDPNELAKRLAPEVPKIGDEVLQEILPMKWIWGIPKAVFFGLPDSSQRALEHFNFHFLKTLSKDMIQNIDQYFDIQRCVQAQMMMDRSKLGQLFQRCGQKELDFLTNSGLWFGFLLGLIQMAVALFFENPWTLSIGGLIVGLATNWLALKWIFEPVNPTKIGPFILQGQFLRRQKEVSAEFSKFFANKILTSAQVWNSILNDPTTSPSFYALFAKHFISFVNRVTSSLHVNVEPEVIQLATSSAIDKLPRHIPVLHSYIDKAMGLESILRVRMEKMSPSQFERVLHPIFEEDEATLIAAGAVLGFAAGLIQQGLETGKIKIPNFWSPVWKRLSAYLETPRAYAAGFVTRARVKAKNILARLRETQFPFGQGSWSSPNGMRKSRKGNMQSRVDGTEENDSSNEDNTTSKDQKNDGSSGSDEKI